MFLCMDRFSNIHMHMDMESNKTFTFSSCRVKMPNAGNGVRMFSHPQTGGPKEAHRPGFPERTAMSWFEQFTWEEAHCSSA